MNLFNKGLAIVKAIIAKDLETAMRLIAELIAATNAATPAVHTEAVAMLQSAQAMQAPK